MSATPRKLGGRVLRAGTYRSLPVDGFPTEAGVRTRRKVAREELEARLEAERLLDNAEKRAAAVLEHAESMAAGAAAAAAREAAAAEHARLAALLLAQRRAEEARAEGELDRTVSLAIALAERLIRKSLELDPTLIAAIATEALVEARGARRTTIDVHPADAAVLQSELAAAGIPPETVEILGDADLARGDLCLHTDLGTLDAKLRPRLERLAQALRDVLR